RRHTRFSRDWSSDVCSSDLVQGPVNGYGERTGNADLLAIVANLELKHGMALLPEGGLEEITRIAHAVAEITNIAPFARQPYVGEIGSASCRGREETAGKQTR